ncbi:hypothetical protein [Rickettsiella endosymbiont of Aleochara curtula]|uniref:hypothetical protein n=1 Tax=Rickettsiella endosymbiont of Aleochara curtula TaxID=3077936 RepID=UPI00313E58F6
MEDLCFQINANGNEEPYQDKPQGKREILANLLVSENNYNDECAPLHQQAQSKAKKLRLWTIGVALLTIVLVAAAIALILFVPPVTAFVLPLFAVISTAIGSWSPLLLLTTLLPSLAVLISSLISARAEHKSQTKLDVRVNILQEINEEIKNIEAKAVIAEFSTSSSQIKTLERSSSETIFEKRNLSQGSSSSLFRLPSVRSSDQAIEYDLINLQSASL